MSSQKKSLIWKLLRSRWLIVVVVMLVVVVGGRAIHRAMQPQYEGKTVDEWFAETTLDGSLILDEGSENPFKKFGTNGAWFLWGEYERKDSKLTTWWMAQSDRVTGKNRFWWANTHEKERQAKALILLGEMGPMAEPLIPEIMIRLKSPDLDEAESMAYLLGEIQRQPEVVVPAIHLSLISTNWNISQRIHLISALGKFGPLAKSALPELRSRLANPAYTNKGEDLYLARTILLINGPGPELAVFTNRLVPGDIHKSISCLTFLERVGTNGRPAVPVLLEFAKTLTDDSDLMTVTNTINKIDPEGVYAKPESAPKQWQTGRLPSRRR